MIKSIKVILKRLLKRKSTNNIDPLLYKHLSIYPKINLLDIGAHHGSFTRQISKDIEINKAILVEPIPENYNYLKEIFDQSSFLIYNNAINETNGEILQFYINNYDVTSSLLKIKSDLEELNGVDVKLNRLIEVHTRSIDSIYREANLNIIHLLKIDVQGSELSVLKGAKQTLNYTEFVWVETSFKSLYQGSSLFHEVYNFMTENKFIMIEISPGYRDNQTKELLQVDVLFKKNF